MAVPTPPDGSILTQIKKMLGIEEGYEIYDVDLTIHINSVFSILFQLGAGPLETYQIADKDNLWSEYTEDKDFLAMVKSYMYLKVRMLFDKGTTSFAIAADEKLIEEMEFRLSLYCPPATYATEGS